ncbi:hypothetical protein PI27_gp232 [Listeria phage WIL-1]|nr:hypothetical protein PI27_gp232 [Listeria phage WIL-1]
MLIKLYIQIIVLFNFRTLLYYK